MTAPTTPDRSPKNSSLRLTAAELVEAGASDREAAPAIQGDPNVGDR
ncbi:hypothetical protein ACFWWT_26520 [Streptomyces sp. NPDC058676]